LDLALAVVLEAAVDNSWLHRQGHGTNRHSLSVDQTQQYQQETLATSAATGHAVKPAKVRAAFYLHLD